MQVIQWLIDHMSLLLTVLLSVSEAVAAIVQLVFPKNKGVSGILAGVIKVLQGLGAKKN